jgi:hypothetical protein
MQAPKSDLIALLVFIHCLTCLIKLVYVRSIYQVNV